MPKVSVVIPTHNRSEFLRLAIGSVLGQTFQDFEIIVVDDASSDNTNAVVSHFRDPRIRYFCHQTNQGVAAARNTGILNSTGEYVAFLDDDDEWLPRKLERQIEFIAAQSERVGCVYSGSIEVDRLSGKIRDLVVPAERGNIHDALSSSSCVGPTSAVLVRKSCFEKVGLFDVNLQYSEDYDMWVRLSKEYHFEFVEEPLVKFFVQGKGLSRNYRAMLAGKEAILNKYGDYLASDSRNYSKRFLTLGVLYCYNNNLTKGRKAFLKAICLHPYNMRSYWNLGLSFLGSRLFRILKEVTERSLAPLRDKKIPRLKELE